MGGKKPTCLTDAVLRQAQDERCGGGACSCPTRSVRAELVEVRVGTTDLRPADAAVDLRSPSARQAQGERDYPTSLILGTALDISQHRHRADVDLADRTVAADFEAQSGVAAVRIGGSQIFGGRVAIFMRRGGEGKIFLHRRFAGAGTNALGQLDR